MPIVLQGNSPVRPVQYCTMVLCSLVLLATPVYRPPEIPDPVVPIQLPEVAPVPVLKTRLTSVLAAASLESADIGAATSEAAPELSAQALYVLDAASSSILYERNAREPVAPASTTKLMTVLVGLDHYELEDVLTVRTAAGTDGATAGLLYGEELTFSSLLYAALVHSANDAAMTIAENYPGGVTAFVAAMNEKATALGMTDSRFANPVGFDHPDQFSSARDLAVLTQAAMKHQEVADAVSHTEYTIWDVSGLYSHVLRTTNELLLRDPTIYGVKTGTTEQAKQVLITAATRDGHDVLAVVLGSDDRFVETEALLEWVYSRYDWVQPTELRAVLLRGVQVGALSDVATQASE